MNHEPHLTASSRWLLLAFLILTVAWFATLGTRRLLEPDEGRYAEISREMVVTGDWVTPRLNGIKYFEKPALQYWATALAYKAFGQNEFAARLWTGLTGFAGVLFAWFTAARLYSPTVGRMAAAILASSLLYMTMAHLDTLDMGLAFFLELATFSFLLAQDAPLQSRAERNWMLAAWTATALGFLSKGLIAGILPVLSLLAYTAVTREFSAWKRLHMVAGLALFLLLSLPWIIAVSIANPEFPYFFFLHEQFDRFLTTIHQRDAPAWYFLPLLIVGALPWTALWLATFKSSWRADAGAGFQTRRFLWIWIAVVMAFFSASHSKLPPYIVPLFPALAVLTAEALPRMRAATVRRHFIVVAIVIGALALAVALVPNTIAGQRSIDLVDALRPETAGSLFVIALTAALAAWLLRKQALPMAVLSMGFGAALGLNLLIYGADALETTRSGYELAIQLKPQLTPASTLYSVDQYEQTLPFYLGRTMKLALYRGELDFGLTQQPELWLPDIDAFLNAWAYDVQPIAVLRPELYAELTQRGASMKIIARQANLLAVAKP
jgi:4-amino-4-deoxy-L-arabinose transferase-like glycosyltransferase